MHKMLISIAVALSAGAAAQPVADTPAASAEAARAKVIAGKDLTAPLFLCEPHGGGVVRKALETGSRQWLEPTKAFDNLFYVGNAFVGVWIVNTNAGLILFDASQSEAEARDHLIPGIEKLGLDPKTIRYVIVTHGHYDHFGGAAWLQRTYGARIGLSAADWKLIEETPSNAAERNGAELPKRDLVIEDGQQIVLGDTSISLYLTPGHTPGTVSAIIPARSGDRSFPLSLLGSTAFPPSVEPTNRWGGLKAYDASVLRFANISARAGAQGLLNTHIFADGTLERIEKLAPGRSAAANPFLIGPSSVRRYYQILHHCLLAAQARPQEANIWIDRKAPS